MTHLLSGEVVVAAPRDRLWAMMDDLDALCRVLPGCEEIEQEAERRYRAVLATRIQFLTLRVAGTAELTEFRPPDHVRLAITGKPLGLVGSFTVAVPIDATEEDGEGGPLTRGRYSVDLTVTGRLAAFGMPILRAVTRDQIALMMRNLERELAGGEAATRKPEGAAS